MAVCISKRLLFVAVIVGVVSLTVGVVAVEPTECDPSNSPCSCDGSQGEVDAVRMQFSMPAFLPLQGFGVLGYATASGLPPGALGDDDADPCGAIAQCVNFSSNDMGRTAMPLGSAEISEGYVKANVIANPNPNPPGLSAALRDLASFGVTLCHPGEFGAVKMRFSAIQEANLADPPANLGPGYGAYEWLDFFIVVTNVLGQDVVVFEQHGTECGLPECGTGVIGKFNDPDLGGVTQVNSEGLQGNRTFTFDQGQMAITEVRVYFNGQGGFAYMGGESFELVSFAEIPEPTACDPTNGPCSCDGSAGETEDVLDAFPSPPLLPTQSGASGYATASTNVENAIGLPDEDSCGGVGQCLVFSNNKEGGTTGRSTIFTAAAEITVGYVPRPVLNDPTANPPGLSEAVLPLASYRLNLCRPLTVDAVDFIFSARQEADLSAVPGLDDTVGAYEWLDFYIVVTDTAGDNYVVFEQHGTQCEAGGPLECENFDTGDKFNVPTLGDVSRPEQEGLQGNRTYTFEQGTLEATAVTAYFNGQGGFCYIGGSTFKLNESSGFRLDVFQGGGVRVEEDDPTTPGTFTVALGQAPTDIVDVEFTFDDSQLEVSPDSLSFDGLDWSIPQEVQVFAVDDSVQEDPTHFSTIGVDSFGSGFDGLNSEVVVRIIDNDQIPTGACCNTGDCTDGVTRADCEAQGGVFQGVDSVCQDGGAAGEGPEGITCPDTPVFRRGDCDQSGKLDFNDAIFHLRFLFLGENEAVVNLCRDACDSDDSGDDDFTDDINSLEFLFLGQGAIPTPGPLPDESHPCGVELTVDDTATCVEYTPTIACP